ncbi:hypothetical protein ACHAXH_002737 [Discostella pseudostelligera]
MAMNRIGHSSWQIIALLALALLAASCNAFAARASLAALRSESRGNRLVVSVTNDVDAGAGGSIHHLAESRRSVLSSILTSAVAVVTTAAGIFPSDAFAEAETMERGGVPLTPFNSLAFNYRGGDSPTVDSTTLNEASIPYSEFLDKLNSGEVAFVEFLAPNGDAAYVTFKASSTSRIRIGEGYPMEDPLGWSSPAFVIKAVAKKGVPYKFVVPGLDDSFKM